MTMFVTMILMVIVALFLAMFAAVRSRLIVLNSEYITDVALNSIMAEYHRELWDKYEILAIDSSYGETSASKKKVEQHLCGYMKKNYSRIYADFIGIYDATATISQVSILSDDNGAEFRARAVEALMDEYGAGLIDTLYEWVSVVEEKDLVKDSADSYSNENNYLTNEIITEIEDIGEIPNPIIPASKDREKGILDLLIPDSVELSNRAIDANTLISYRKKPGNVSNGNVQSLDGNKLLFIEYLSRKMNSFCAQDNFNGPSALEYEMEYIIGGHTTDVENLRNVVLKISLLREAANIISIYTDSEKMSQIDSMALAIAELLLSPELYEPVKLALIVAWAYMESIHDVKHLLEGGDVPLIKNNTDWYYSLDNTYKSYNDLTENEKNEGLKYDDYLKVLMAFEDVDAVTLRAMDIIEANIRLTKGNERFRLDACYDFIQVEFNIKSSMSPEITLLRGKSY